MAHGGDGACKLKFWWDEMKNTIQPVTLCINNKMKPFDIRNQWNEECLQLVICCHPKIPVMMLGTNSYFLENETDK